MLSNPNQQDLQLANKVVDLITSHYDIHKVIFFGSRARGTYTKWSDYDILVIMDFDIKSFEQSALLMQFLHDNGLTQDIQILARTAEMYESDGLLKQNIENEGVLLYERGNSNVIKESE